MNNRLLLQPYEREGNSLLSKSAYFPPRFPQLPVQELNNAIDQAFQRCLKNKKGVFKPYNPDPKTLVKSTIDHLRERSDPILNPYFLSLLDIEDVFEFDAVSYEMQRHRMSIGIFYQYLILELMRNSWPVFDGSREGDVVADITTPGLPSGLRLYMSIKKSKDTVGGQDISGVIRRLENEAKSEKNLTRPYLCVVGIATPSKGKLKGYDDRSIKMDKGGKAYSLNCEFWGPGFIFPYITGHDAITIYSLSISRVSEYLPFMTLSFKKECSSLLQIELRRLNLINKAEKIDVTSFLRYIIGK